MDYKLQYFLAITAFLCVLLKVSRLATEEDDDHYDKRHLAGDGVQDESDEEVDYHVIVKEHLAHEGARGVQVDATQLHSTRV